MRHLLRFRKSTLPCPAASPCRQHCSSPGGKKDAVAGLRGRTPPSEADIAALREALNLQSALDLARASGNSAQIKALERKQALARLTSDFERAGYTDAATKAQDHLEALDAVRERSEQVGDWEKKSLAFWEGFGKRVCRQNDPLLDRLGFEAEIARQEGDPDRIKERERELWIQQRINDLLSPRPELTADAGPGAAAVGGAAAGLCCAPGRL